MPEPRPRVTFNQQENEAKSKVCSAESRGPSSDPSRELSPLGPPCAAAGAQGPCPPLTSPSDDCPDAAALTFKGARPGPGECPERQQTILLWHCNLAPAPA
ncbi:hypothetical protein VULLAG_LOCUS6536 [Vulpes lagopus]